MFFRRFRFLVFVVLRRTHGWELGPHTMEGYAADLLETEPDVGVEVEVEVDAGV